MTVTESLEPILKPVEGPRRALPIGVGLLILITAAISAMVVLWAAARSDDLAVERQTALVSHLISERIARIAHDQESVAIWDDAVLKTGPDFDATWIQDNIGSWMYEYFGHDRAYILNAANQPIAAMADGIEVRDDQYQASAAPLEPLVRRLREMIAAGDLATQMAANGTPPRVVDLLVLEGRPSIVSVMPIVSASGDIVEPIGTERLLVSVRFLDHSFLTDLSDRYMLDDPRFQETVSDDTVGSAYLLRSDDGSTVGAIVWAADRPGGALVIETAPALIGAVLILAILFMVLAARLDHAYEGLRASASEARHRAAHDSMTGLPNRDQFAEHLAKQLGQAGGKPVAILLLDVDRFKNVNDVYGHPAGDEVLREVAGRLLRLARAGDTVGRMAGDEFAVLVAGDTSVEVLSSRCEEIIGAVGQPIALSEGTVFVGVTIGVATAGPGITAYNLIREADIALYRGKLEGRNVFRIFTPDIGEAILHRQRLEEDLRRALNDESQSQLSLAYQPIYSGTTETLSGLEALMRWTHPVLGEVPPSMFIPIAEESGLVRQLGSWVVKEVCQALAGLPVPRIAVNVSAIELRQAGYAHRFLSTLEHYGARPERFEIEVTESVLIEEDGPALLALHALRLAGVSIALDDFGTGYSSLRYLRRFALDRVKIDRSFVKDIDTQAEARAIVQAIITLAHAMNMRVTAEGVETGVQRAFLRRIGCDELQGYALSPALSREDVEHLPEVGATLGERAVG